MDMQCRRNSWAANRHTGVFVGWWRGVCAAAYGRATEVGALNTANRENPAAAGVGATPRTLTPEGTVANTTLFSRRGKTNAALFAGFGATNAAW